jgi:hypothetical protein
MTTPSIKAAYKDLLTSIPQEPFLVKDSSSLLKTLQSKVDALKKAIACLNTSTECLSDKKKPKHPLDRLTQDYTGKIASLSKRKILSHLGSAASFLFSPLTLSEKDYETLLATSSQDLERSLPSDTLNTFHRTALGEALKTHQVLGKGSFGVVVRQSQGDVSFASKTDFSQKHLSQVAQTQSLYREVCVYSMLHHPHIAKLLAFSKEPLQLRFEYLGEETLAHYVNSLPLSKKGFIQLPSSARYAFFSQIIEALVYLHNKGLRHGDLKLDNIMLVNHKAIKLMDFGLAISNASNTSHSQDPFCPAPETVVDKNTTTTESWSFGVIVHDTFRTHSPFLKKPKESQISYRDRLFNYRDTPFQEALFFEKKLKKEWDKEDSQSTWRTVMKHCFDGRPQHRFSSFKIQSYLNLQKPSPSSA